MIVAAAWLAAQALAPAAAAEIFMATCSAGLDDPAAFAAATGRLGFAPVEERSRGTLFRSGNTELLYVANESCQLRGQIDGPGNAERLIGDVSSALGLPAPAAIAMHPPGWVRYRWPIAEGARPRFYLAARTMIDHEGPLSVELSIHAGPAH